MLNVVGMFLCGLVWCVVIEVDLVFGVFSDIKLCSSFGELGEGFGLKFREFFVFIYDFLE